MALRPSIHIIYQHMKGKGKAVPVSK